MSSSRVRSRKDKMSGMSERRRASSTNNVLCRRDRGRGGGKEGEIAHDRGRGEGGLHSFFPPIWWEEKVPPAEQTPTECTQKECTPTE